MSSLSNLEIEKFVNIVYGQTNYSKEESLAKLYETNFDYMKIIRNYIVSSKQKEHDHSVKSVNQEIYRQLRYKLDDSSLQYHKRNPIQLEHVISNFKENEIKRQNNV